MFFNILNNFILLFTCLKIWLTVSDIFQVSTTKAKSRQKILSKFSVKPFKVAKTFQGVRYKTWDLRNLREGQKTFLKGLDTKGTIQICKESKSNMEVLVECSRSMQVEKLLRDRDIVFDSADNSSQKLRFPIRKGMLQNGSNFSNRCKKEKHYIDWEDYYPLNSIYSWMDNLEKLYPATCTTSIIGTSVEGRPIKILKISNSDAANTGVWLDGCMHAREWISVCVVTYIADYIATNFQKLPTYITNKDWYFLPIANPDGYHFTHIGERQWRKNRARFGNSIVGVDLNRNFGLHWGQAASADSDGSTYGDPLHHNYRGTEAFSEPESCAIKDFILYTGTPFKIFLSFHAYSELITFPWCYTAEPCPDYVNLLEGAACMAKAIYDTTGKMYKVGNFKDIMYFASGTSLDWSYGVAKIPFSYLVELRSKEHKFLLPKDQIKDCCREAAAAVAALAEFVDKRTCINVTVLGNRQP